MINDYVIFCEKIIEDKRTNGMGYINTIESVEVSKLPIKIQSFSIGTLWKKQQGEKSFQVKVSFVTPDGTKKNVLDTPPMNVSGRFHRVNITLDALVIQQFGEHKFSFDVSVDGGNFVPAVEKVFYVDVEK